MLYQWAWCISLSQHSLLRQWATTPVHKFYLWNHRVSPQCRTSGYAGYHRMLGRFLGINTTTDKMFHRVIEEAYPNIIEMLDEICEDGKEEMKRMHVDQLGSWKWAVTTSDGCWHIRGFFSQNATFVIWNWLTGALLWYGHACMKGSDPIVSGDLYQGTAKSAEGYLAGVLFQQAKEEGCHIEINWQDQDSLSEKSFRTVYSSTTSSQVKIKRWIVKRAFSASVRVSTVPVRMRTVKKLQKSWMKVLPFISIQ